MAGLGQVERADLPGAGGEQLAVGGEVAGEEDGQRKLGELARLEVDRPDVDPDARVADAEAEARHEREHQQHDPAEQQQPLVAGQVRCPLHDHEREHEHGDRNDAPRRLQPGQAVVEAGDHDVAHAMEQGGEREHRRVGASGEPAHGEVGDDEHAEEHGEERDDACWDDGVLAERGERVGAGRDQRGHHDEGQFRRATGVDDARGHRRVLTARRSSWSTEPWWSLWWWSWSSSCVVVVDCSCSATKSLGGSERAEVRFTIDALDGILVELLAGEHGRRMHGRIEPQEAAVAAAVDDDVVGRIEGDEVVASRPRRGDHERQHEHGEHAERADEPDDPALPLGRRSRHRDGDLVGRRRRSPTAHQGGEVGELGGLGVGVVDRPGALGRALVPRRLEVELGVRVRWLGTLRHVDDDDGDVVATALAVGHRHQLVGG